MVPRQSGEDPVWTSPDPLLWRGLDCGEDVRKCGVSRCEENGEHVGALGEGFSRQKGHGH